MVLNPAATGAIPVCAACVKNQLTGVRSGETQYKTGEMTLKFIQLVGVAFFVFVMSVGFPAMADGCVGVRGLSVDAPERAQAVTATIWYPAGEGGHPVSIGGNAVFEGVAGLQDARIADGSFPVVLISLGGLRAAPNLAGWIAADLAAQGFIAVVVPPARLGPKEAKAAVQEIWKRPTDLSAALSALESSEKWKSHVDLEKAAALGFFLGGTAVLSLAGVDLDADRFIQACDDAGTGMDCAWFASSGVDLRDSNLAGLSRSRRDPRLKAVIAVDPELSTSLGVDRLAAVAIPVEVINLGQPGSIAAGLDASTLATFAPQIGYTTVPNATQFSAFSICTAKGAAILAEDGGSETICNSDLDVGREHIHAELAALITGLLKRHLVIAP